VADEGKNGELKDNLVAAGKIGVGFIVALVVLFLYVLITMMWYLGNP
jgi:hypothetical protein